MSMPARLRARRLILPLAAFALAGVGSAEVAAAATSTVGALPTANLILNGGGESDTGSSVADGNSNVDASGWDPETGSFTVTRYGVGNHPGAARGCEIGGGANFFSGGHAGASTGVQTIDVSPVAGQIDTGTVPWAAGAHLGGFLDQDDNARVEVDFLDGDGAELGTATVGPVLRADRANVTRLLWRSKADDVPVGTRSIVVTLRHTRVSGSANDGYADNVQFVVGGGVTAPAACDATPTPSPTPTPTPTPSPTPTATPVATPTPTTGPIVLPPPVKTPKQLGPPKTLTKPSTKAPVVKASKPTTTPAGGTAITVTPTTTCNLTASSVFTKPGGKGARAAAPGTQIMGGLGTSTLKVPGATVKLPKQTLSAVTPGQATVIQVQPVTTPTKPSAVKPVDPPKVSITTTVTCVPVKPSALPTALGFGPVGFNLPTLGGFSTASAPKSTGVGSTVNPPATQPAAPSGGAAKPTLTPGPWSGKLSGVVSAGPGTQAVPAGTVSFTVLPDLRVVDFALEGAETCVAPAGSKQGGSVQSIPFFTTVAFRAPIVLSPAASTFPKKGFGVYSNGASGVGTKSIKIGTSVNQPGLTATGPSSITGSIEALRINGGQVTSTCSLRATFTAAPGGERVVPVVSGSGYTD